VIELEHIGIKKDTFEQAHDFLIYKISKTEKYISPMTLSKNIQIITVNMKKVTSSAITNFKDISKLIIKKKNIISQKY
jgi:hypothetical protein